MKERVLRKYCDKVKRYLLCDKETKKKLSDGLFQELLDRDFPADLTQEQLCSQLGRPADMAKQLSEAVPLEQQECVAQRLKMRRRIILGLCLLVIAFFIGILLKEIQVAEDNSTYYVVEDIEEIPNN